MNPIIKEDIKRVLIKAIDLIKNKDYLSLTELSNHTIHNASIYQDEDSISIAVLIYAMSKIIQRCFEKGKPCPLVIPFLKKSDAFLVSNKIPEYRKEILRLFRFLSSTDIKMKLYIEEVIAKARVKKGIEMHRHGVSVGRIASVLGITQWELMSMMGKTKIHDVDKTNKVQKRLQVARGLF